MKHAIDTNIAIYALLGQDPKKTNKALETLVDASISVQVLSEFIQVSLRKFHLAIVQIEPLITCLSDLCTIHPLTPEITAKARHLTKHHKLAYYNAQIIASAIDAECTTLFSEDGQDERQIEGLILRDPFKV